MHAVTGVALGAVLGASAGGSCPGGGGWLAGEARHLARPFALLDTVESGAEAWPEVSYTAFDGSQHTLRLISGRYTALLLPAHWLPPHGLSETEIARLLDHADLTYRHFADLMDAEPRGEGPTTLAVVPQTCGTGCAMVGQRRIEFRDTAGYLATLRAAIADDIPESILVHEFAHNFDLHGNKLRFWSQDPVHAWNAFSDSYIQVLGGFGRSGVAPAELLDEQVATLHRRYLDDPNADFASCLLGPGPCAGTLTQNQVFGGLLLRYAQLHGPAALRRAWAVVDAAPVPTRPPPGAPADAGWAPTVGLWLEALSEGAEANLSCYFEHWRLPIVDSAAARVAERWPNPPAQCLDLDGDGYSALQGDCDDGDPTVFPDAPEALDGRDRSCSGFVDDLPFVAAGQGETWPDSGQITLTLPVGASREAQIRVRKGHRLRARACIEDGLATLELRSLSGTLLQTRPARPGFCARLSWLELDGEPRRLRLLHAGGAGLQLDLAYDQAAPWPQSFAELYPPIETEDGLRLRALAADSLPALPGAELRHWLSGQGFVGSSALAPDSTLDLATAPTASALERRHRAQIYLDGLPAGPLSEAVSLNPGDRGQSAAQSLWHDRSRVGHGFELHPVDGRWFLVFYSYDVSGVPEWFAAIGDLEGDRFDSGPGGMARYRYQPGAVPPQQAVPGSSGRAIVQFGQSATQPPCDDGIDRSDAWQLARFDWSLGDESASWCVEPVQMPPGRPVLDFTGHWMAENPGDRGWGLNLFHRGRGQVGAGFAFVYDHSGEPRWTIGTDFAFSLDGGVLPMDWVRGYCRACPAQALERVPAGTVAWTLDQPQAGTRARVDLQFPDGYGGWERDWMPFSLLSQARSAAP